MSTQVNWGLGADIERIDRFRRLDKTEHRIFLERIYTSSEREYCWGFIDPAPHLAVRFSAKEAVIKALKGLGMLENIARDQIEVLPDTLQVPRVCLRFSTMGSYQAYISLSHSGEYALATAIVIKASSDV